MALAVKYTELRVKRLEAGLPLKPSTLPWCIHLCTNQTPRATGKALQLECVGNKHTLKLHASSVRGTKDATDDVAAQVNYGAAGEPQWCPRQHDTGIRTQCDKTMKENRSTL